MPETKEWTVMFYMASDNPLAISIVSQLKALKNAGFHHDVNVIAQFDPFTEGTPTHIFDVNLINKLKQPRPNIGFSSNDSFVRNLIEDKLWRDEKREKVGENGAKEEELVREALEEMMKTRHKIECVLPRAPEVNGNSKHTPGTKRHEMDPFTSLKTFLDFCSQRYPARRYMLFMLGHGVVVGNDVFMFDEHSEKKSITLAEMGEALNEFNLKIKEQGSIFELVSFHSCSVSSLEVAWELKDTANYMLASQAPAFVGSWPYRQILIRLFNYVDRNSKDLKDLLSDIFYYCVYNGSDYLLAGYSHQVTLCNLGKVEELRVPMKELSAALVNAMTDPGDAASKYVILWAHWLSQSFFDEMYTDLYDFCHCIVDRCERIEEASPPDSENPLPGNLPSVKAACGAVLNILAKSDLRTAESNERGASTVVAASEFVGPAFQYSHGLSVYFPWAQPSDDSQILEQYETYKFHQEFNTENEKSWLDFLEAYFDKTRRFTKRTELIHQAERRGRLEKKIRIKPEDRLEKEIMDQIGKKLTPKEEASRLQEDIASLIYNGEGPLGGVALKTSPSDRTGGDCTCPPFKNFPRDTRASGERRRKALPMPVSETLLGDF